jgi:hypothetical protein
VGVRVGQTGAHEMHACLIDSFTLMCDCLSEICALVHSFEKKNCTHVHTCLGEIRVLWEKLRVCDFCYFYVF